MRFDLLTIAQHERLRPRSSLERSSVSVAGASSRSWFGGLAGTESCIELQRAWACDEGEKLRTPRRLNTGTTADLLLRVRRHSPLRGRGICAPKLRNMSSDVDRFLSEQVTAAGVA